MQPVNFFFQTVLLELKCNTSVLSYIVLQKHWWAEIANFTLTAFGKIKKSLGGSHSQKKKNFVIVNIESVRMDYTM